jgi:hypothetical protein
VSNTDALDLKDLAELQVLLERIKGVSRNEK